MSTRANALADRLLLGARKLKDYAEGLSDAAWVTMCPNEQRPVGVMVHHVASMFPVELDLIQVLASGKAIEGVTWDMVDGINAEHAGSQINCSKAETLALFDENSQAIAEVIRALSDEQLNLASPISLNADAPLTTQYFIEDHAVSHSFVHLASIQTALNSSG
jgi:hypothetical protein